MFKHADLPYFRQRERTEREPRRRLAIPPVETRTFGSPSTIHTGCGHFRKSNDATGLRLDVGQKHPDRRR